MKLSKNSFTYELIDRYFDVPTNICSLFWKLIFSYLIILALAYLITSPIVGVYFLYIEFFMEGKATEYFAEHFDLLITFQGVLGASTISGVLVVYAFLSIPEKITKLYKKNQWKNINKRTTNRTGWKILKEYIKAKKSKMCTIVEWEDD